MSKVEEEHFLLDPYDPTDLELTTVSSVPSACLASLPRHRLCDSLPDCPEGEDEADCQYGLHCLDSEFPCLSGRCLPLSWVCDGRPDCQTGEDEMSCASSCLPSEVECDGSCLPAVRRCDGVRDCGQGEDEQDCQCGEDQVSLALSIVWRTGLLHTII